MISFILLKKILSLFCCILFGFILSKKKLVDSAKSLSVLCMYVLTPCVIISSMWLNTSGNISGDFKLSFLGAFICSINAIVIAELLKKPLRFSPVETISVAFANAGNLTVPLVSSALGSEYVVYTIPYIVAMNIFFWSIYNFMLHIPGKNAVKSILTNPNIIATIIAFIIYFCKIPELPIISDAFSSLGDMIGPLSMIIVGISLGNSNAFCKNDIIRISLVSFVRLIFVPMISMILLKVLNLSAMSEDGKTILLITMIAAAGPTATTIVNVAQIELTDSDTAYASKINLISTILCVITIPLIVYIYQMII